MPCLSVKKWKVLDAAAPGSVLPALPVASLSSRLRTNVMNSLRSDYGTAAAATTRAALAALDDFHVSPIAFDFTI